MQIVLPFQNNRWQDVQEIAARWAASEPGSAEARYYQGEAALQQGDETQAMTHFQQALRLHPNHPSTLQSMVQLLQKQGKVNDAEQIRLTLKDINPELLDGIEAATQSVSKQTEE